MSENLGDALLTLRTDDAQFTSGVNKAEGQAKRLGATLDRTRGQTDKLGNEMAQAAGQTNQLSQAIVRQRARGRENVTSLGAQRAGMQQLSFQLNDVATMYALGARPMQIFASQSGQVIQAVQLMTGGTSRLAAFLGGPWGVAITSAVVVLTPFVGKLFEGEKAFRAVELASNKFGDAQGILGRVIDLTTGKINTQSQALMALARAQIISGQMQARADQAAAQKQLAGFRSASTSMVAPSFGMAGAPSVRLTDPIGQIVEMYRGGGLSPDFAIRQLQGLAKGGGADDPAMKAIAAIANEGVASANLAVFDDAQAALNGDQGALEGFLTPSRKRSGGRKAKKPTGPTQAEIDADYESELTQSAMRIISARAQIATNAEERALEQQRLVEWERIEAKRRIEADEHYSDQQKAELIASETRLADMELAAIEQAKQRQIEGETLALMQQRYQDQTEALQIELSLANTEKERKAVALKLLEAEEAFLRQRLTAIIFSETVSDAERERAEIALAAVRAGSEGRRAEVSRANETSVERYLRQLTRTPEQINEALDNVALNGLDTLEDSLVNVMTGVESLGDLFKNVADQIIADLLRIAVQRAIIGPLADVIFGPDGDGGGLGGLFAGFFAKGGTIPTGQFGVVGEAGPELAFATPGGVGVLSNAQSQRAMSGGEAGGQAGTTSVSVPISIDATGADAAAIARLNARLDTIQRDLPGNIVRTVQDAGDRRILSAAKWR